MVSATDTPPHAFFKVKRKCESRLAFELLEIRDLLAADTLGSNVQLDYEQQMIGTRQTVSPIIELADLDGDGDLDFVAAPQDFSVPFAWFENADGLGTIGDRHVITTLPVTSFESADMDLDGDLDVVVAVWADLHWFENVDGLGTAWTRHLIVEPPIGVHSFFDFALGDLNGDSFLDVVYDEFNGVRVYLQNGDGTFDLPIDVSFGRQTSDIGTPESVALGDIDEDGHLDIVYTRNNLSQSLITWFRNIDGTGLFEDERFVTDVGWNPEAVLVDDIDGDGRNDILSGLYLHRNLGPDTSPSNEAPDPNARRFERIKLSFAYVLPATHEFAVDFDLDGDLDILAATGWGVDSFSIAWFENNGRLDGSWPIHSLESGPARSLVAGDINNDGMVDIAMSDMGVRWWPNESGSFSAPVVAVDPTLPRPQSLAHGDIDGDGDADILAASSIRDANGFSSMYDTAIAWLENDDGAFDSTKLINRTTVPRDPMEPSSRRVWLADVDMDGDADALWFDPDLKTLAWHANDGTGHFAPATVVSDQIMVREVLMANLNGDSRDDLLLSTSNGLEVAFGSGSDSFSPLQQLAQPDDYTDTLPHDVVAGDIDNDGDIDVLAAFRSEASGLPPAPDSPDDAQTGSLTGYINDGVGGFESMVTLVELKDAGPGQIALGDLDGDDDLDVVMNTTNHRRSIVWYENHEQFVPRGIIGFARARRPLDLQLVDLDGNQQLDVVYTDERGVYWFANNDTRFGAKGTILETGELSSSSRPQFLDIDHDGDLDFLTLFDHSHEIALYRTTITPIAQPLPGDVDGNGMVDIADYLILSQNFLATDATRAEGDLNGDGKVNVRDFIVLSLNFGAENPGAR